jgi:L-ribulose-5-phosphate 3-epimerase
MQGRLLPPSNGRFQCFPREGWDREFPRAAAARLDCIEWIYDVHGLGENPLDAEDGPRRISALAKIHGVGVFSVCAAYFIERPLATGAPAQRRESRATLVRLLRAAESLGATRIVLPFVDSSSLRSQAEMDELVSVLVDILGEKKGSSVELHLETDLGPGDFARLLERLPDPRVRVNYDSGNSASLGYRPREEFGAYGSRVGSIHVKDRLRGGGTVALGTGAADFDSLAGEIENSSYREDFILQAARGREGDEVAWAASNRRFVMERLLQGAPP